MPRSTRDVLDCSRPAAALFWLVVGIGWALLAMYALAPGGNWASLLRVGSESPARERIERELGPVVFPDSRGHDGQLYYLIARDPFATGPTVAILSGFDTNPPRYRYRRILFPLLAGGFGQFSGRSTLYGIICLVALGMGLTWAATADLASQLRLPPAAILVAAVNPGALLSAAMLTPDLLALGLALAGVALAARHRVGWAITAFALAGLTKEIYLLVSLAVAVWQWRERRASAALSIAVAPALPVLLWSVYVSTFVPDLPMKVAPFGLPMAGLVASVSTWMARHGDNVAELSIGAFVAASFIGAILMLAFGRNRLLRWVLGPWIAVAVCSTSIAVWDIPSNVARQFSILWPLTVLLCVERMRAAQQGQSSIGPR